jgi:hypothetical protein
MSESIGAVIAVAILYIGDKLVERWKKRKKLSNVVNDNIKLYPIIRKMQLEFAASRVCIVQFHNGEKYYSGKHIQRMTMSHEVTNRYTPDVISEFTDVVIDETVHNIILTYLDGGECYSIEDIKNIESSCLSETLEMYKIKSLYSFPLRGRQGDIIGQLNFNFHKAKGLTKREEALVRSQKSKIENILNH